MALVTLSDTKTHLGITGATEDARLTELQAGVESWFKGQCRQELEAATYTEFYEGLGVRALRLRQKPVRSVTEVRIDPDGFYGQGVSAFSGDALIAGVDYALRLDGDGISRSGLLYRLGSSWPAARVRDRGDLVSYIRPGYGNIKVIYDGGYLTIPDDIQLAVKALVGIHLRGARGLGLLLLSESLAKYSYTAAPIKDDPIQRMIHATIGRYRRLNV